MLLQEDVDRDCALGSTTANGATVLQSAPYSASERGVVVLCFWHGEFVTWVIDLATREAFWGHYHGPDLAGALADFNLRAGR